MSKKKDQVEIERINGSPVIFDTTWNRFKITIAGQEFEESTLPLLHARIQAANLTPIDVEVYDKDWHDIKVIKILRMEYNTKWYNMQKVNVTKKGWKCQRCGHEWIPRNEAEPRVCPKCKNPYWDKPKKAK